MLFTSSLLGEVEVNEATTLHFPHGIPAFENCTRFQLFHDQDKADPSVFWMQSLDNPDVLFSVVPPTELGLRYEIELGEDDVAALELSRPEDAAILLMVYKAQEQADESHPVLAPLRANVRNPLVVNLAARRGLQKGGLECDILFHNRG